MTLKYAEDTTVGSCLRSLTSHSQPVMQVRWSGERSDIGGVIYSAGRDCVIKVWNPKDGSMLPLGVMIKMVLFKRRKNRYIMD